MTSVDWDNYHEELTDNISKIKMELYESLRNIETDADKKMIDSLMATLEMCNGSIQYSTHIAQHVRRIDEEQIDLKAEVHAIDEEIAEIKMKLKKK